MFAGDDVADEQSEQPCDDAVLCDSWETMVRTLYNSGLFFVFPFAIAGMFLMLWWNWRIATWVVSWIVPSLLLYTAYYWAPESPSTSYIRFFLTIIPALGICAA